MVNVKFQNDWTTKTYIINTLRPRQNGRHFTDDIFKRIFFNENVWISIKISLKFVPKVPINKIPALFQIMAWRRPGDKPLSEAMVFSLLTYICVTRPQWVNNNWDFAKFEIWAGWILYVITNHTAIWLVWASLVPLSHSRVIVYTRYVCNSATA